MWVVDLAFLVFCGIGCGVRKAYQLLFHQPAPPTLVATTPSGSFSRSKYSKRLKITKSGTYRVRFVPPNGGWLANNSRTRTLTVH